MLSVVLALLTLVSVPQPDHTVEVTFTRTVSSFDAQRLVRKVAPEAYVQTTTFEPLTLGTSVPALPTSEQVQALYDVGAISVETRRVAAMIAAAGSSQQDIGALEEVGFLKEGRYNLTVEFPGMWSSQKARESFWSATGMTPGGVTKTANVMHLVVASGDEASVRARLLAQPEVVSVVAR